MPGQGARLSRNTPQKTPRPPKNCTHFYKQSILLYNIGVIYNGYRKETQGDGKKIPIMVRFDPALLQRVNEAAKHRGVSRSAWIQFTLSRALDQGEG
jgi:hypothetical protein